ncbi:MAG: hypothetical protein ACXVY3_03215 [Gaiellaceae bacterium]
MRRTPLVLWLALAALAFPIVAAGATPTVSNGTLEVDNASGSVTIQATGTVLGVVDGTVWIRDVNSKDSAKPKLVGCDSPIRNVSAATADPNDRILSCTGDNVRITMIGGAFRLKVVGTGIYMSAVGMGRVVLDGQDWLDPGTYSLNGADPVPLPSPPETFNLQDSTAAASSPLLAS